MGHWSVYFNTRQGRFQSKEYYEGYKTNKIWSYLTIKWNKVRILIAQVLAQKISVTTIFSSLIKGMTLSKVWLCQIWCSLISGNLKCLLIISHLLTSHLSTTYTSWVHYLWYSVQLLGHYFTFEGRWHFSTDLLDLWSKMWWNLVPTPRLEC